MDEGQYGTSVECRTGECGEYRDCGVSLDRERRYHQADELQQEGMERPAEEQKARRLKGLKV